MSKQVIYRVKSLFGIFPDMFSVKEAAVSYALSLFKTKDYPYLEVQELNSDDKGKFYVEDDVWCSEFADNDIYKQLYKDVKEWEAGNE